MYRKGWLGRPKKIHASEEGRIARVLVTYLVVVEKVAVKDIAADLGTTPNTIRTWMTQVWEEGLPQDFDFSRSPRINDNRKKHFLGEGLPKGS